MTNVQQFDDETLVPLPFPGDVPKEPLEDNKDLTTAIAAYVEGVALLERTALEYKVVEMGLVQAQDWTALIKDLCEKYLSRPETRHIMTNVQQFDDETLVPLPFPGDVPKEPLEDNKDLTTAIAAYVEGVALLERTALEYKVVEMGLVQAQDWTALIKDLCEKYLSRPTAISPPVMAEVVAELEAMVRTSTHRDMVLHVFDQLRPRLLTEIRNQMR